MAHAYFITHPDVVVDPEWPVAHWPLSERGRERMRAGLAQSWMPALGRVFSSGEQKALDGASILAEALGIPHQVIPELGENDRSATGFLPPDQFWQVANQFFAEPERSVRGWERAVDAQTRIVAAVRDGAAQAHGDAAFLSHGAVGALLHSHLLGERIAREREQPRPGTGALVGSGGGYYLVFDPEAWALVHGWRRLDP